MSNQPTPLPNPLTGWVIMGKAADKVGFTRKTLKYWADQGYITSYRVGVVLVLSIWKKSNNTRRSEDRKNS